MNGPLVNRHGESEPLRGNNSGICELDDLSLRGYSALMVHLPRPKFWNTIFLRNVVCA